jgi:hypothetical protein
MPRITSRHRLVRPLAGRPSSRWAPGGHHDLLLRLSIVQLKEVSHNIPRFHPRTAPRRVGDGSYVTDA